MIGLTHWADRAVRAVVGASVVCVGLASSAYAQDDQLKRGAEAVEKGQWQAAIPQLREAIKLKTQESATRVGVNPILRTGGWEYLPHYFLGAALFGTGDCSGAVTEWATSESMGAIQKSRPEFMNKLQNGYVECEKKGVLPPLKLEPALTRVSGLIKEANTAYGAIQTQAQASPEIWKSEANLQNQFERARGEIENARARWEAARASRLQAHVDESANAVARARTLLEMVESGLRTSINSRLSAQRLVQVVGDAIATAERLNNDVEGKKAAFTPGMTTTLQEGRDALGRSRTGFGDGQKSLNTATLNNALTSAETASARFRTVLDEIGRIDREVQQRLVNDALTRALDASTLLDEAVATLDRRIEGRAEPPTPEKVAERQAAQREVDRARRRLDGARKSDNADTIAAAARQALEVRDKLIAILESFGPLTLRDRGVREPLQTGADLYLRGEYQQAVAALGDTDSLGPEVPFRLHFHLFKAAALYQLSLKSGKPDDPLRAQALAEVQRARGIDSAFQPDARAFSPRFVSFYQSVTVAAPSAPAAAAPAAPAPPEANAPSAR